MSAPGSLNAQAALSLRDFWSQRYAMPGQYFLTRHFSLRLGSLLAYVAYRFGMSPNAVTALGLGVMLLASLCLGLTTLDVRFVAAALFAYQLGFGLDCADGQLARATGRTGAFGAWLDVACDHMRYVALLLAIGSVLVHAALPPTVILTTLFMFGAGATVTLHTVVVLKRGEHAPHGLSGMRAAVKALVRTVSDTPAFLLLVCVLAPAPWALAAYVLATGTLSLTQALALAWLRIR